MRISSREFAMSIRTVLISAFLLGSGAAPALAAANGTGFTYFDDAQGIGNRPVATTLSRAEVTAQARETRNADVETMEQGYPTTRSTDDPPHAGSWMANERPYRQMAKVRGDPTRVFDGQYSSY